MPAVGPSPVPPLRSAAVPLGLTPCCADSQTIAPPPAFATAFAPWNPFVCLWTVQNNITITRHAMPPLLPPLFHALLLPYHVLIHPTPCILLLLYFGLIGGVFSPIPLHLLPTVY